MSQANPRWTLCQGLCDSLAWRSAVELNETLEAGVTDDEMHLPDPAGGMTIDIRCPPCVNVKQVAEASPHRTAPLRLN